MKDTILYIAVPCYNEKEVLNETAKRLEEKLQDLTKAEKISVKSRILFINDGSKDNTWKIIKDLHSKNNVFSGISLSRNRGHQNALLAGLMTAKEYADIVISMDADLQDDINAIDSMLEKYEQGFDIVYGVRSSRKKDSFFKRNTAIMFYRMMMFLGAETVYNHADFRLMSKRALEGLAEFKEVNLFLRGLVPMIGYPSATVEYERAERFAGESKYPLKKMIAFANDGITSLSIKPITLITRLGFIISSVSLLMLLYTLIIYLAGKTVTGWSSLILSIWFLGGLQLLAIGVIGEYIGKIYKETKQRPRYIISETLTDAE